MSSDDGTAVAIADARAWLTRVGSLPPVRTDSQLGRTWTGPERLSAVDLEIWRGVDVAFRQPAVTAAFDLGFVVEGGRLRPPMATTARLAARGVLLQPVDEVDLDLDVRSIIGLMTLRFFSRDANVVQSVSGGMQSIEVVDRTDETDVAALLSSRASAQLHEGLPDWFRPPLAICVLEVQDSFGRRVGEIAMSHRPPRWYVALPPTTIADLRGGGVDGTAGDRSPLIPRPPVGSRGATVEAPDLN